jgi:hypothetical protein
MLGLGTSQRLAVVCDHCGTWYSRSTALLLESARDKMDAKSPVEMGFLQMDCLFVASWSDNSSS